MTAGAKPLAGKSVLVAGARSGMGRATALAAAAAGARVAALARSEGALDEVGAAVYELAPEGQFLALGADATIGAALDRAVARAVETFGGLDALVNSIGTNIPNRHLDALDGGVWDMMIANNLTVAFNLTKAVLPHFRRQGGGLIVHVSSVSALRGDRSGAAYQAAKAGVLALARATMEEERENGIRTTVVLPGLTDTPLIQRRPVPPTPEQLQLALQPEDVAAACLFAIGLPPRAHVAEIVLYPSRS